MVIKLNDFKTKFFGTFKNEFKNERGKLLDIGCGNCNNDAVFMIWGMTVYGIDIYKHKNAQKILGNKFKIGSILKIPFEDNSFDFVFAKDVLHHIDEKEQKLTKHIQGLEEMRRVCKPGGKIIILEANRYNPLFYPHMVLLKKHNHFVQSYFEMLIKNVFAEPKFIFFEAHSYPKKLIRFFKLYEKIMESFPFLRPFLAYNLSITKKF